MEHLPDVSHPRGLLGRGLRSVWGSGRGGGCYTWRGLRAGPRAERCWLRADCISRKSGEGVFPPDRPLRVARSQRETPDPRPGPEPHPPTAHCWDLAVSRAEHVVVAATQHCTVYGAHSLLYSCRLTLVRAICVPCPMACAAQ